MSDWRQELRGILEGRARTSRAEQESARFELFLRQVATPALREVADELAAHKREAQVREAPAAVVLTVRRGEVEEISFRLLKRPVASGVLPYVEARLRKGLRIVRMEGFLREPQSGCTLDDITADEIIRCFLKHYRMVLDAEAPGSAAGES